MRTGPLTACDEFGTPYVVLTLGGVKPEGVPAFLQCTEGFLPQAGAMFLDEIESWLRERKYIIWRVAPRVDFDKETRMYKFYCRLSAYNDEIMFKKDVDNA